MSGCRFKCFGIFGEKHKNGSLRHVSRVLRVICKFKSGHMILLSGVLPHKKKKNVKLDLFNKLGIHLQLNLVMDATWNPLCVNAIRGHIPRSKDI